MFPFLYFRCPPTNKGLSWLIYGIAPESQSAISGRALSVITLLPLIFEAFCLPMTISSLRLIPCSCLTGTLVHFALIPVWLLSPSISCHSDQSKPRISFIRVYSPPEELAHWPAPNSFVLNNPKHSLLRIVPDVWGFQPAVIWSLRIHYICQGWVGQTFICGQCATEWPASLGALRSGGSAISQHAMSVRPKSHHMFLCLLAQEPIMLLCLWQVISQPQMLS